MIKLQNILKEDLNRWVKEKWTDQHGRPCGNDKTKGVKKCRPSKRISNDTPKTWNSFDKKEKKSLVAQKRRVGMGKRTPKAEAIVGDRIHCDNCNHNWPTAEGGNDLYMCHACEHDNTPIEMIDEAETPKRDACYHKVRARYTKDGGTWPSAYGGLALSKCRNVGAANWGDGKKSKNESENTMMYIDEACWSGYEQRGMKDKNGRKVPNCVSIQEADSYCEQCLIETIEEAYMCETPDYITVMQQGLNEAEYQGRKVALGKPMQGDVKKFKVYVKNDKGNVVKVNFGDPNMRIRKSNPARRRSFRARHKCHTAKDRTSARYWSCRKW